MESLGKEINLISQPPDDYFCLVCIELLVEPFLTDCCGQHLCRTCRGRLLASGKTECPMCRKPKTLENARLNKHFRRQVNDLMARCKYYKEGCAWEGELRNLQEHLDPMRRRCDFVLITCFFGCGEIIRSSAMKEHMKIHCCKRPSTCQHCGYHNAHNVVTEKHHPVCFQFPVECPNKCQAEGLKRCQLQAHIDECPLQVIACPFSGVGCIVQLPRREMEAHEEQDIRQHLRLVMKVVEPKQQEAYASPSATVRPKYRYIFNLPPVEFTMMDYLQMIETGEKWTSPPFYTHQQGYKMCLEVVPNDTHMSVFACLMKGEHDSLLQWPFRGDIVVELLNWRENKGHLQKTVSLELNSNFTTEGLRRSHGVRQFISHSSLSYNSTTNTEYLLDDCLRLRIRAVALYSTPDICKTPTWQDPLTSSQSPCEFTLTEFSKRKRFNNRHYGPPFYTHLHGYKMCLNVNANGYDDGKGTHVSVYFFVMRGEHDDQLQWPFEVDVIMELLNWREDKGHYAVILNGSIQYRVTEMVIGNGFGDSLAIPHSSLTYNPTTNIEYLQDDCLRLRVKTMVFYSTPLLSKTPTWQDSLTASQSSCEFTLTEFSKRKQFNNQHYSPPFFTHPQGYKMCLNVNANGYDAGKGTHVSVYVTVMRGEHDDQLQWPFECEVIIELLNWREDKEHYKKTLTINKQSNFVRVTQGEYGNSWGYFSFIPHSSLSYNSTTNTEYLQDDCLRVRVTLHK